MANAIEARGLCKRFRDFELSNVSFDVPAGYITGFIGPNGAGKTTTIKILLGAMFADSGRASVLGENRSIVANDNVGVVLDAPLYVDDWRASDVGKALGPFYPRWSQEKYARHVKRFAIDQKKKVKELSRGMKIKLQFAVALSHGARLLILDEPTSGLDPVSRDEFCDMLREFAMDESRSVLFSTHITSDLEKIADYIVFILDGKIAYSGSKDDLLAKYARVTGGAGDLDANSAELIIGRRDHGAGFEGMVETASLRAMPKGVMSEGISLDEIVVFMNRSVDRRADSE